MAITTKFISANSLGAGIRSSTTGQDVVVLQGISVMSSDAIGIIVAGTDCDLTVLGTVYGAQRAVQFTGGTPFNQTLTVGTTGQVIGSDNLNAAVVLDSNGVSVMNHGLISASGDGIEVSGLSILTARIYNDGVIEADRVAILRPNQTAQINKLLIVNDGTIRGGSMAFDAGTSVEVETVRNRGIIDGDVDLGAGNDLYDTRRGETFGTVRGEDGNDTFLAGAGEDVFDGGNGIDTLDFRGAGGIVVSLSNDVVNTGRAAGDTYSNFENVLGSNGADSLTGNGLANDLTGGNGNDTLNGKAGIDVLRGGLGSDTFVFDQSGGADLVFDFGAAVGNNDGFLIDRAAFGVTLAAGKILAGNFHAQTDNVALDGDDVLIFRTTDRTLWVDADGFGAKGPVQIATVGGSTALDFTDFILL